MHPPRPPVLRFLAGLLLFQGLSGLGGGIGLMVDPSGEALGLSMGLLQDSPFPDYLVPGLVLFIVLGMAPVVVARMVWEGRPGSWMASLAVGAALVTWIVVQILTIGYQPSPPLQAVFGAVGVIIIFLSMTGSVQRAVPPSTTSRT